LGLDEDKANKKNTLNKLSQSKKKVKESSEVKVQDHVEEQEFVS